MVNPHKESLEVVNLLRDLNISMFRGNHEDYIIDYFSGSNKERWNAPNLYPISLVAKTLGRSVSDSFKKFPLGIEIVGPNNDNVYVCHASPFSNIKSFYDGINLDMEKDLLSVNANLIVSGHRHVNYEKCWRNKQLLSFGSVGGPRNGCPDAEYLLLTYRRNKWEFEFRSVKYDVDKILSSYLSSGYFHDGGPISWMLYDEILTGERRLSTFFSQEYIKYNKIETEDEWKFAVKKYLDSINRWKTNARTEGYNTVCKQLQKRAYGYKNFKNYRLKVLYACR